MKKSIIALALLAILGTGTALGKPKKNTDKPRHRHEMVEKRHHKCHHCKTAKPRTWRDGAKKHHGTVTPHRKPATPQAGRNTVTYSVQTMNFG